MATIPNAYYDSPWIKDAAQNLASALAPPDPEKMLAKQKMQWELSRAQELARMEDEQYASGLEANDSLAKVLDLTANPVRNPLTNEIDRNETERQVIQHLGHAVGKGGIKFVDPGMKSAGPAAPTFAVSEAMANQRGQIQSSNIAQQIQGTLAGVLMGQQGQDRRQALGFENDASRDAMGFEYKMKLLVAEQEARMEELKLRIQQGGGNPLTISGTALNDLTRLMWQQVANSGYEIERGPFSELVARSAILMSQGRNAPTAVLEAYRKHVDPNNIRVDDGGYFGLEHRYIVPNFDDELPPAAQMPPGYGPKTTFSGVLAPGAIPGITPAAVPPPNVTAPSGNTPPASQLLEGHPRKFPANGQVWELRNGIPVRRPDLED